MQVVISKRFLKELAIIPSKHRKQIEVFVFDELPLVKNLGSCNAFEKMTGYDGYYKARFGNYRIGAYYNNGTLELRRVLDRKDIYKFFP